MPSDNTMLVKGMAVNAQFVAIDRREADTLRTMLLGHMHVQLVVGCKSPFDAMASDLVFDLGTAQEQLRKAREDAAKEDAASDIREVEGDTVYMIEPYFALESPIPIPARLTFNVTVNIVGPHAEDVLNGLNRSWDCWRCVRVGLTGSHIRDVL